jgi:hypothetical protein
MIQGCLRCTGSQIFLILGFEWCWRSQHSWSTGIETRYLGEVRCPRCQALGFFSSFTHQVYQRKILLAHSCPARISPERNLKVCCLRRILFLKVIRLLGRWFEKSGPLLLGFWMRWLSVRDVHFVSLFKESLSKGSSQSLFFHKVRCG